ncbi:MAG: hypothetical protein BZY75_01985 [SAR202 cluster bacterium Io17-Chloro-G7]|nr:MAG: hypothetical protein BZY75_01985 [SAR202 cluster bacterium Io17-Chloro-G7]
MIVLGQPSLKRINATAGLLLILLAALALAACSTTESSPTAIPTATPTPTPPATLGPLVVRRDLTLPTPDPTRLAQVKQLLSSVPSAYHSVVALDIDGLKQSPVLNDLLDSDRLGIPSMIPIDASGILDRVAVASGQEGQITLIQGAVDVASLLNIAGSFGFSLDIPDPEDYRGHMLWDISILGITLAIGQADDTTVVFSSGTPAGGSPAATQVKESLDTFDGIEPGFLSRPNIQKLLDRLPSGFATAVFSGCVQLANLSEVDDIPACLGAGISADIAPETTAEITVQGVVTFYAIAAFPDSAQASTALDIALSRLQDEDSLPFDEVSVGQEQELIWAIIVVSEEQVEEALAAFQLVAQ